MVEWREKRRKKTNIPFILCQTVNVHSKWQRPPKNSNQNRFERPKHWMFQTERKYRNKNWKTHTIIVSLTPARCLLVSLILSPVAVVSQLTRYTCTHTHSCASLAYTHTQTEARAIAHRLRFSHESELDCRSANKTYIIPLLCDVRATQRFIHIRHITQSSAEALTTTTQTISSFERHRETTASHQQHQRSDLLYIFILFLLGRIYLFLVLVFA